MDPGSLIIGGGSLVIAAEIATWCFNTAAKSERQYAPAILSAVNEPIATSLSDKREQNAVKSSVKHVGSLLKRRMSSAVHGLTC